MPSTWARQFPQSPPGTASRRARAPPHRAGSPSPPNRPARTAPAARRRRSGRPRRRRRALGGRRRDLGHWRIRETLRVEQRLGLEPGRPAPPDDLDLEAAPAGTVGRRERSRHVPQRDRFLDVVAVRARGHPADDRPVVPDRLVADDVGRLVGIRLDDECDEPALGTGLGLLLVRRAADELVVELDVALQAGLVERVDRAVLAIPRPVALLEPQRHQRPEPEQPDPVLLARGHQLVEQRTLVLGSDPQLVAELAAVVDPADERRDDPDLDPPEIHEAERRRWTGPRP